MQYCTATMRAADRAASAALDGRTVFEAFPPLLSPGESLRIVLTSARHGIGGAATELTHAKSILDAATAAFPGRATELHLFGGNALALDGLGSDRFIFHKGYYQQQIPGTSSLDPLQPLKGEEFLAACAKIRPHYVVALDAAEERSTWNIRRLLDNDSVIAAIVSSSSLPQSGMQAVATLQILSPGNEARTLSVPLVTTGSEKIGSVYPESAFLSRLFGGDPKPFQAVALNDLSWGKATLLRLGYSPASHNRLVYVHEGTSTDIKELTPTQIRGVMAETFRELKESGLDTSRLFFALSPQPIERPEVAQAYLDSIRTLGATAAIIPDKTTIGQAKSIIALADAVIAADTFAYHAGAALASAVSGHFSNPQIVPLKMWGHGVTVGPDMNAAVIEEILIKEDLSPKAIREIGINNALVISEGPAATREAKRARGFLWDQIP